MKNLRLLAITLAGLIFLSGCDGLPGNGDEESQISIPDLSQLTQTAYADEGDTGEGFKLTALAPWNVSITQTRSEEKPDWIKLFVDGTETYSGEAGTFTFKIELTPNYSGSERKAEITITSGDDEITVSVTQNSKDKNGEIPKDPDGDGDGNKDKTGIGTFRFEICKDGNPEHFDHFLDFETEFATFRNIDGQLMFVEKNEGYKMSYHTHPLDALVAGKTYVFLDKELNPEDWPAFCFEAQEGDLGYCTYEVKSGSIEVQSIVDGTYTITIELSITYYLSPTEVFPGTITGTYTGKLANSIS